MHLSKNTLLNFGKRKDLSLKQGTLTNVQVSSSDEKALHTLSYATELFMSAFKPYLARKYVLGFAHLLRKT